MDDFRPEDIALIVEMALWCMGLFAAIEKKRELCMALMIATLLVVALS
jgi:hypothetical protein